jgi:hypothetical protein
LSPMLTPKKVRSGLKFNSRKIQKVNFDDFSDRVDSDEYRSLSIGGA